MAPPSSSADELRRPLLPNVPQPESPPDYYSTCKWYTYLFFWFPYPLMKLGNSRTLTLRDVPPCPAECRSELLLTRFLDIWEAQKKAGKHSIAIALWKAFWKDMVITGIAALLKGIGVISGPIFLYFFVDYASGNVLFEYEGVVLIVCLAVVKVVENLAQRHWYFGSRVLGSKVQSAMMAAIYQKELLLSSTSRSKYTSGEIVNFISVDAYRLCEFSWRLHWSWLVPVILICALGIAAVLVGLAVLPALVIIVAVMVGLTPLIKSMQLAQRKFMETQDERLRATSEVLLGMKVIKLQGWEEKFDVFIHEKRDVEFKNLAETQNKRNWATIIYWLLPIVLTCVVLATCLFIDITLTSTLVFTVLATFRIIQDPVRITPEVLASIIQAQISLGRLQKFLEEKELSEEALSTVPNGPIGVSEYMVRVDNTAFSWNPEEPQLTLRNINMVVKRGETIAVCGTVGSGKSSLLLALLGEMPKLSGSVYLSGSVAYVPQSAWIQSVSIRDNILFGKPYDEVRYRKAIRASALEQDIKGFSHGDLMEIGERGTNLSGGQKQRLQLARAVYNDADIYFLDDPFSAVDAQTGAELFKGCVLEALRDKTVILVTHQMEFLRAVDTILVMQDGEIKQAGRYDDLLQTGPAFQKLVRAHEEALHTVVGKDETTSRPPEMNGSHTQYQKIQKRLSREESISEIEKQGAPTQLVQEEEVVAGKTGLAPYFSYVQIPKSGLVAILLILSQLLFSGAQLYSNLWLATGVSDSSISSQLLIWVYCGISFICVLAFALRSNMVVQLGLRASKSFFSQLMTSVMKAPMGFFDSTPSGRILNRVSVDVSVIDLDIPFCIGSLLGTSLDVICIIVVTCYVTWENCIAILPVLVVTHFLQRFYSASARELNRINSTTKAPIVNNSSETMSGAATIRAFKEAERFRQRNLQYIDRDASAYIYKFASIEWMVLQIELSCTVVLIVAACLAIFVSQVSGGLAGLSVTYALALNSSLVVFSIWQGFLAIFIVSVERIKQYLQLPMEAPAVIESSRPSEQWPSKGDILLDHLQIRYQANTPLVLKGVTCTFKGGQKVGVVGRTGSGKTTLISSLFRLVEPAGGRICIDGVDISTIGLHDLRFKLGIIPQEPVLFQGTVRTNLDPLNQYTDMEVWEALRKSQLAEVIEKLPHRLDSTVSDQGENWSAGQRQLFCLGRVLLKRSQVLVLDEATASIDSATDAFLQKAIRVEFAECTVITVAHRIPTVIDSDMVLALRDGWAMEYDSPKKLMDRKTSLFAQLVAEYWAQAGSTAKKPT